MTRRPGSARSLLLLAVGAPLVLTACMGYPAQLPADQQTAPTMAPPDSSGESRLPGLLSQLQSGATGVELFDGSQNDVLAAQDAQDKGDGSGGSTPTPGATVSVTPTKTPAGSLPLNQPTPTRTPTKTPTPAGTTEAQPTPTPTSSASPTSSATPTATATPTPTAPSGTPPSGTPPSEGTGGSSGNNPPSEG